MKSYKRTHAADAANIFIRNLLCEISEQLGGFSEDDWKRTRKFFDGKCAYTGKVVKGTNLVKDHLIGHNKRSGGLHLYGNIVPASKEANASKGGKSLEEFFQSDALCLQGMSAEERRERLEKIKAFQKESGYPEKCILLKLDLPDFLAKTYDEILEFAEAKMNEINDFIEKSSEGEKLVRKHAESKAHRIFKWADSPSQICHKIIAVYLQYDRLTAGDLVDKLISIGIATDAYGSVHSMMTDGGNSYGKVFMEEDGYLVFIPELRESIKKLKDKFHL